MGACGNFLEYAGSKCSLDVGFGKMILLYADKTAVLQTGLTAEGINAAVLAGGIIGIIKGWHTVTGAPVAETNVERPGSAEMKLIRSEILADTLMFENTLSNNEVIADLTKAGTLYGLLIDDFGSVFGEQNATAGAITPMRLNFTGKVTTSFQKDNTSDKSVSVTVRYLVKEVQAVLSEIEVEEILSKTLIGLQFISVTAFTDGGSCTLTLKVTDKSTGEKFDLTNLLAASVSVVSDINDLVVNSIYDTIIGEIGLDFTSILNALTGDHLLKITISGDNAYSKEFSYLVQFGA